MDTESLPIEAVKKATNLIRDARLAIAVGLIPILGFVFILRLVQWYLLKQQYPGLLTAKGEHAALSKEFRSAVSSLWLAVLLWPVLIVFIMVYSAVT
jgi:hypothetical protein